MNIQITSDNMQITESMRFLVNQKIEKFTKLLSDFEQLSSSARVVLNKNPDENFIIKLEVFVNGEKFFTDEIGLEFESTLIEAVDELVRLYKTKKEKQQDWQSKREHKELTEDDLIEEI